MFWTDLGDEEGYKEWNHRRIDGHEDLRGDDDIDTLIRKSSEVLVDYKN